MHKVSRSLLLAGVVAFGTLTAACGDKVTVTSIAPFVGVQSVTVTPANATIPAGTTIQLSASVLADASTAKTVTWTTSSAAVASVDQTGKVTGGSTGGTATIIATSTADAAKSGAAAIVVTPPAVVTPPTLPTISIGSVNTSAGGVSVPVNLGNVAGQIDVTVNTTGGGTVSLYIAPAANCGTNTIAANDKLVAQQLTTAQAGAVILSYNTATLAGSTPAFLNGNYCIKASLAAPSGTVVATNTAPITLNNVSFYKATLTFATQTGGPTSAVSSINGLNYNQGTLTAVITPINYNTGSPVALISGVLSQGGELNGGAAAALPFTNVAVTGGVATIVFTDTSLAGVNSIFKYTSAPAGDALTITSATDAAGNPFLAAAAVATGIRIDNDPPALATTVGGAYTVTAANGYIGAAYSFASGTTAGAPPVGGPDVKFGVQGVGGVTTTYYVGPAGGSVWTAGSCVITGLTVAAVGTDLANTNAITADQAKVVVSDALGNKVCFIVPVTTVTGSTVTFGVDKIAPTVAMVGPTPANAPTGFSSNNGASNNTGYAVTKNFSFVWQDTISQFINGVVLTPLKGTLTRNFFVPGTSLAADCVIGTYTAAKACTAVTITPTSSNVAGPGNVAPWNVNSIEFTSNSLAAGNVSQGPGYYTFTGTVTDLAGNVSASVTRLAAFDPNVPTVTALTQSPAAVAAMGTATISGTATDGATPVDLTSSKGRLAYATAFNAIPFASVTGTSFGPNFDATVVTTGTATVAIPNVYRGMQTVDGTNTITAGGVAPTATITATNVGGVSGVSAAYTILMATVKADIFVGNTFTGASSVPAPAATAATTTLAISVGGLVADPAFQNQPFAQVDIYKLTGGELVLVASNTTPVGQDQGAARTYTYTSSGIALTATATNTFYAVGRNAAGDAVISNPFTVVNP